MNQRDALLAAVIEEPGDDAPRLVLADWLEENGDGERAQFIRLSLELAREEKRLEVLQHRRPFSPKDDVMTKCQATVLCNRAWLHGSFHRNAARWVPRVGPERRYWTLGKEMSICFTLPEEIEFHFRRGFPEVLRLPSATWLSHSDRLTATCPLTDVWLTTWPLRDEWQASGRKAPQWGMHADLTRNWPRIRFHFPETRVVERTTISGADIGIDR